MKKPSLRKVTNEAKLVLIGAIHFGNVTSGMAAGTFYLLLPYTAYHVGQAHHVLPAALLIWAIYAYRRPWLVGLLLGTRTNTENLRPWLSRRLELPAGALSCVIDGPPAVDPGRLPRSAPSFAATPSRRV